ncbi:hypothetical protein [Flavobacterium sp. JP2137]|uniref:hypothetical protein n=1 Tax=Flavobacterium sp. JP2137 TaxID=3414510 RepID=UPI003D300B61
MKKALLLFATLGLATIVQSCTSDLEEATTPDNTTTEVPVDSLDLIKKRTYDNGDLGKDLDKRK